MHQVHACLHLQLSVRSLSPLVQQVPSAFRSSGDFFLQRRRPHHRHRQHVRHDCQAPADARPSPHSDAHRLEARRARGSAQRRHSECRESYQSDDDSAGQVRPFLFSLLSVTPLLRCACSRLRSPASGSFRGVIAGALVRQAARMEAAYKEALEESRQQKRRLDLAAQAAVRAEEPASKRPRTDPAAAYAEASTSTPPPPPSAASTFAAPMSFPPSRGSAAPFPPAGSGTPPYPPSRSSSSTPFPPSGGGASPHPPSGQHPFPSTSTPPLAPGALFDVAVLPPRLVVDLLFTSLAAVSRPAISEAVRVRLRTLFIIFFFSSILHLCINQLTPGTGRTTSAFRPVGRCPSPPSTVCTSRPRSRRVWSEHRVR